MIEFKNVSFSYNKNKILKSINFKIEKGDFVAIIGSNGAGKTTISKLANGLLKPTSGEIYINNENIKDKKVSLIAKTVGYLFQNPDRQICKNTIKEEILFSLKNIISDKEKIEEYYNKAIKFLKLDENISPFNLSRGQKQQLALCCTIASQPDIIILDEPTTGLDYKECDYLFNQIKQLNEIGKTIVIISHDIELVAQFAKTVICISDGELVCFDKTNKALWDIDMLKRCDVDPPQIVKLANCFKNEYSQFSNVFTYEEMFQQIKLILKSNEKNIDFKE
ncbi:MAG: ABC transporter ATP-binding protein [Oscillospiraceae bacterium]